MRGLLGLLLATTLLGCTPPPSLPPPPAGVRLIAVEQPVNRTGDALVVEGPGLLQRILKKDVATVPDLLAEDLRRALAQQGFRVVAPGTADAPVLRTEILRWQPYAADYDTVTIDLVASLADPESGRELWKASRADWVVATYDADSRGESAVAASAAIAEALVEGWQPAAAP